MTQMNIESKQAEKNFALKWTLATSVGASLGWTAAFPVAWAVAMSSYRFRPNSDDPMAAFVFAIVFGFIGAAFIGANRNLTRTEWVQYINSDPTTYRATCEGLPLEPN
jgi:hypothetical protein